MSKATSYYDKRWWCWIDLVILKLLAKQHSMLNKHHRNVTCVRPLCLTIYVKNVTVTAENDDRNKQISWSPHFKSPSSNLPRSVCCCQCDLTVIRSIFNGFFFFLNQFVRNNLRRRRHGLCSSATGWAAGDWAWSAGERPYTACTGESLLLFLFLLFLLFIIIYPELQPVY